MLNRSIFIFSIIGLVISAFLAYEYLLPVPIVCPLTGTGCETVRKSEYSTFLGISIPYLGVLYYAFIAIVSIWLTQKYQRNIDWIRLLVSGLAFAFGAYLTLLEAYVIKAYCFWCLSSFIVSIVIMVLVFVSLRQNKKR